MSLGERDYRNQRLTVIAPSFLSLSPRTIRRHISTLTKLGFIDKMYNSLHLRSIKKLRHEFSIKERRTVEISLDDIQDKERFTALVIWKAYVPQQILRRKYYLQRKSSKSLGKRSLKRSGNVNMGKALKGSFAYSLIQDKLLVSSKTISNSLKVAVSLGWIQVRRERIKVNLANSPVELAREFGDLPIYRKDGEFWLLRPNIYMGIYKGQKRSSITH
jgi:DNA-binding transcriptional ArsR family regulator